MENIYYGGLILTMDEDAAGEAILIADGKIKEIGELEQLIAKAPDAVLHNLNGHVMMPSFLDAHSHFTQTAGSLLQVSLEGVRTEEELVETIQRFIRENQVKEGDWVQAKDYDNTLFAEGKHPGLQALDRAAGKHPLLIQHKSGHFGLMNQMALELVGITEDTEAPDGGKIGKEDGHLTGYLEENAYFMYQKKLPMPKPEALLESYKRAQELYASYGITTVQEGMLVREMCFLYQLLAHAGLLKLDLVAYPDMQTYFLAKEELGVQNGDYKEHIRIGGIKIFLDGSPQGRTAWMRTPYRNSDYCGYGTMTEDALKEAFSIAGREQIQLLAHCNGDAAAEQFLKALEQAEMVYPVLKTVRPVIIHGQLLGIDQLPKVKELGAMLSFFVAHVYHWGDIHVENFGAERASKISPTASAKRVGVPFTFHQDTPVIAPDMWETIWCAVNRITKSGVVLGEEEAIDVDAALRAVTVDAAWQYGEEKNKGSLTPGKRADFIIIDENPYTINPMDLRNIQVLETYKDGVCIFKKEA